MYHISLSIGVTTRLFYSPTIWESFITLMRRNAMDVFSGKKKLIILVVGVLVVMLIILFQYLKRNKDKVHSLSLYMSLFVPVAFMLLWYCVAFQPSVMHAYFQYRNICIAIWAVLMFITIPVKTIAQRID